MTTVEKIIKLIDEKGIEQQEFANAIGIKAQKISEWKSGKTKSYMRYLDKIANYFGVSVDYLLNGEKPEHSAVMLPTDKIRHIPLFESVAAGFGAYADSTVIGYEPVYIDSDWEADNTIAIKVKGDSMYPKIEDGDIVIVCKDMEFANGNIIVALIDGDDGVVKRIQQDENTLTLESINPEYAPRRFVGEEMNRVQIVGVVRKIIKSV